MQFVGRNEKAKNRRSRRVLLNYYSEDVYYPHSLSMYKDPPTYDLTLHEFETYAFERVKVLYYLDSLSSSYSKGSEEYDQKLTEFLKKNYVGFTLTTTVNRDPTPNELEWRKRDHVSHFILRMAYCRSDDLRHWFLEKELDLFKYRFSKEPRESLQLFLKQNNLTYDPISDEEKQNLVSMKIFKDQLQSDVEKTSFYKVPFTEVLNLVRGRKVFLCMGNAYVPQKLFVNIISTKFRGFLSKWLTLSFHALPQLEEGNRIVPILKSFSKEAVATAYDADKNKGSVNIDDLDSLSKTSYPLCMRNLHQQLSASHHLKYQGRQQYSLYLKGIGVTLESALKFWRREFTKVIDLDKFEKQYSYNIRHNYGKEGKRVNYSPFSCMRIITTNPPQSSQEHHGCPFKHCSEQVLRQRLISYKCPNDAIEQIIQLISKHHYQIACQKYFAVTHGMSDHTAFQVTHPNQYYDESRRILTGGKPREVNRSSKKEDIKIEWSATPVKQNVAKQPLDDFEDSALDQIMMDVEEENK